MDTQTIMLDRFVKQAIMADDMPWFIGDGKTTDYYNGDDNTEDFPQLTHLVYDGEEKSKLAPPTTRYLNIIKQGYKDCKLNIKSLNVALLLVKHLQR